MRRSPVAVALGASEEQRNLYRDLFRQQGDRLWNADRDVDWSLGPKIPPEKREPWLKLVNVFYGLEYMGLETIQVMMSKATHQLRDPNLNLYLAAQCQDEARHAYVLDRYLETADGKGMLSGLESGLIDKFGTIASFGFFRVENWLTSTLFSENFAALFLQMSRGLPDIDPLAADIFRFILRDEVRHVNFLHTVLPGLIGNLSRIGRIYLWQSQLLLVSAVSVGLRRAKPHAVAIGIDIEEFKDTLTDNLDAQFRDAGIDEFLQAAAYRRVMDRFIPS
ncbi:MAG: ferritin-like domain-containing protein [Chloroflexi bacterium]|nr:ferritin-like domain-containing protein [Chloroflexota bacterium]